MKFIVSRYNQDIDWIKDYTNDVVLYDRSEKPLSSAIIVPNIGSDIYDKFTYIIDNYDNLPDVAVYTKANLFKYISKEEFDRVKDSKTFTPLLTQYHKTTRPISFYENGMYYEINNSWYMPYFPSKHFLGYWDFAAEFSMPMPIYLPFAPGSNYILPKDNILKRPKSFYVKMKEYLSHDRYPAEAQILERALYTLWS